jgi:hypothetical protein
MLSAALLMPYVGCLRGSMPRLLQSSEPAHHVLDDAGRGQLRYMDLGHLLRAEDIDVDMVVEGLGGQRERGATGSGIDPVIVHKVVDLLSGKHFLNLGPEPDDRWDIASVAFKVMDIVVGNDRFQIAEVVLQRSDGGNNSIVF